jgi:hypothetical protein
MGDHAKRQGCRLTAVDQVTGVGKIAVGHQRCDRAEGLDLVDGAQPRPGSSQANSIGGTNAPRALSAPSTSKLLHSPESAGGIRWRSGLPCRAHRLSGLRRRARPCGWSPVPGRRCGLPRALRQWLRRPGQSGLRGTMMRRMAVHFWPALAVISRTTSLTRMSNSELSGVDVGPSTEALRLSCSAMKRTLFSSRCGLERSISAVLAEPVKLDHILIIEPVEQVAQAAGDELHSAFRQDAATRPCGGSTAR